VGEMIVMAVRSMSAMVMSSMAETIGRMDTLELHLLHTFVTMPRRLVDRMEFRILRVVSVGKVSMGMLRLVFVALVRGMVVVTMRV
jgi:hypothetical protein